MQGEQKFYQLNIFQRKPASISVDIVNLPGKGQTLWKHNLLWGDRGEGCGGLGDDLRRERDIAEITAKALSIVEAPSK